MKAIAKSDFHTGLQVTFTGLVKGVNIRRLRGGRSRYCLDTHGCGCGFPVGCHTKWHLPEGWQVDVYECGPKGEPHGRGYIRIELIRVGE